ncbi:MAG: DUF4234 domain-containing protein [Defluviitaleaceae bacterium]|nr:DUF4234 domain-containing protein [Defluviitaleaceae bacterium]
MSNSFYEVPDSPLKEDRGLLIFLVLTIVTLGFYAIYFFFKIGDDINYIATPHDHKYTVNYAYIALSMLFLSLLTGFLPLPPLFRTAGSLAHLALMICQYVWLHRVSNRIGRELTRRGIDYNFSAVQFWLWSVLGVFILIGPLVYLYKLCRAMNMLAADFNYELIGTKGSLQ